MLTDTPFVHVDAEVLADSGPGRCEIEDGAALPAETARRLTCDAPVVAIVERADGEALSVGRRTRTVPPAIRRALASRDGGCRFPGCVSTHRLHAHHVKHWAHGGETCLANTILLCPYHHRLVHEGGFDVQRLDDGAFHFFRPDRREVRVVGPHLPAATGTLVNANRARGLAIDARTCRAKWDCEHFDYDHALFVAMANRRVGAR